MSALRSIVRCGLLTGVTSALYLLLIAPLAFLFPFRTIADRWRLFILRTWARTASRVLSIRTMTRGTAPTPPFLMVSNHLSYVDIIVLASIIDCVFVARGDLRSWPVIGLMCQGVGTIFVDRDHRSDVVRVNGLIEEELNRRRGVVLFAEGTSTQGQTVAPFKSSLLELPARKSLPVSYAAVSYRTLETDTPAHLSVCWWGDMTFVRHLFGLTRLSSIEATVAFGSRTVEDSDRKELARKLWSAVNEEFIPVVALGDQCAAATE